MSQDVQQRRAARLDAKIATANAALTLEVSTGFLSKIRFVLHHIPEFSTLFQIQLERYIRKVPMWTWRFLRAFVYAMITDGSDKR